MSVINLLSSKIYNRIAAGEVVERPYSVVKELVENSIDAGAKNITVEITGGGISSIRVYDDGSGIQKSELKKALLPHATSKISSVEDLDEILTLGFRGEALASIASVSKITITSKPREQESGATIFSDGGEMGEVVECASPDGTEIVVRNLFFNTPAREKFLKTERGEESDITGIVSRFILGNPEIAIKYISNGKTIFQSFGDGLESAMTTVYGNSVLNDCYFIEGEKNGVVVSGYIGKQYFSKPNRTYQSVFMNGRYVVNQTVSAAISNAYAAYLMKRQYPFYVISIKIPPETVDVNVHPNKIDVRFSDNRVVYSAIYSVVSKALDGTGEAINIIKENKENNSVFNNDYVTHNEELKARNTNFDKLDETEKAKYASKNFESEAEREKKLYDKYGLLFCDSGKPVKNFLDGNHDYKTNADSDVSVDIFAENKAYLESLEKKKTEEQAYVQEAVSLSRDLKYVGQVLNTYLIFDDGQDVFFVDQHAAHERMLYDKFIEKINNNGNDVQPLLVPYVENLNSSEYTFLLEKADVFYSLGIDITDFGANSIKISTLPTCLADMNVKAFLSEILSDLNGLKNVSMTDILKEKIAQKACKAAIKSGVSLTDADVNEIMLAIKQNIGLKCPHGRPVVAKITRTEMDKWFKRIL